MYAYLEGTLTYKSPSLLSLAVGGVGYEVHISLQTFDKIQHLEHCRLYTHLLIRDDAWQLFGFADEAERSTFRILIGITGVGASTARILLSSITPGDLERIVATGDAKSLERVKGIGAKTAQRLLLELKGKLMPGNSSLTNTQAGWHNSAADDALIALMNLGINRSAAETAIKKLGDVSDVSVEELIKQALRVL